MFKDNVHWVKRQTPSLSRTFIYFDLLQVAFYFFFFNRKELLNFIKLKENLQDYQVVSNVTILPALCARPDYKQFFKGAEEFFFSGEKTLERKSDSLDKH
jgi:hypothetical protein